MRSPAGSGTALLAAAAILLTTGVGRAELQRVEAVGIYGIRDSMRSRVIPRDEAIANARWEGVSRVALELIGEFGPSQAAAMSPDLPPSIDSLDDEAGNVTVATESGGPSEGEVAELLVALGDDLLPYMRSYRILDDRGEVPALFNDEPDVSVEYVVVVAVIVDVDRVTQALARAGLIAVNNPEDTSETVIVELMGLSRYEALEVVLEALRKELGATRVRTMEFSQERQILAVEGPFGPDALLARLADFENPQLQLEPIGVDSMRRRIRLNGRWQP
jgi:hypothetical protein